MRASLIALCLIAAPARAELFVDVGAGIHAVEAKIANIDETVDSTDGGVHLGFGARRAIGASGDIGVRLELDTVDSDLFFAVRAFDYRHHISDKLAVGFFLGAARLDLGTPAYGYYLGAGVTLKEIRPRWDLGVDLRFGDEVARDNVLPSDPQGGSPDNFHDVTGLTVYLSYRF